MLLHEIAGPQIKSNRLTAEQKQYILQHCKPYLSQIDYDLDKYALFRGLSDSAISSDPEVVPGITIKPGHYKSRIPQGTPPALFSEINSEFTRKFGVPFRNGMCVTGSYSWANKFGHTCQIIPVGEFKFCWSKYIPDFGTEMLDLNDVVDEDTDEPTEEGWQLIQDMVNRHIDTDLKTAIRSHNEIAIYCDKCLVLTQDYVTDTAGIHEIDGGLYFGMQKYGVILSDIQKEMTTQEGEKYITSLSYKGYTDWDVMRLPELKILKNIIDSTNVKKSKYYLPSVERVVYSACLPTSNIEISMMSLRAYDSNNKMSATAPLNDDKKYIFVPVRRVTIDGAPLVR